MMDFLSAFLKRLRTPSPPTTFTSPHNGRTYHYGKCYDAAGNLLEEALDSMPYIGEIMLFAGNFVPLGFLACDGALIQISENDVLFALIGTTFGGDGTNTFALPDLRGRLPIGAGNGPGLTSRTLGEQSGKATVNVAAANLPTTTRVATPLIKNRTVGTVASGFETGRVDGTKTVTVTGLGQAYDNMPPYLAMQYCIAVFGIFPTAN
jgi:microcystin-dependent protein